MKKKSHAAIAVALVTGGLASKTVSAGLNSPAVQNGNFSYDIVNNPSSYGYDFELSGWYRASGAEAWSATQFNNEGDPYNTVTFPSGAATSEAFGVLEGSRGVDGQIFQQIGTYDPDVPITISFLQEFQRSPGGHSVIVSLYSGGSVVQTYSSSYGANYGTYNLSNATLLGSQAVPTSSTQGLFTAESVTIPTGNLGNSGDPLWLSFSINSPNGGPQIGLDNVNASEGAAFVPINLTWVGVTGIGSNTWDTSSPNWANSSGGAVTYADYDTVTFDDTAGSANTTVTLNTTVNPGSVTFNNNTNNYLVTGTGSIAGTTGLTKSGTGTVILSTSNTYSGATVINAGTLQLGTGVAGQDGSIQNTSSITNNGSLVFDNAGDQTYPAVFSGSGLITKNGSGTLILTAGQNTETGALIINAGTVTLAPLVSATPASPTQDFSSITINSGATLNIATVHTFGYGGSPRSPLIINGGTVTNSLGNDNYLGNVTMTGGTVNGSGEFRMENTGAPTDAQLTTLPSSTTATISVSNLAIVPFYSSQVIFNVAQGTVPSGGPDLLISSTINNSAMLTKTGAGTMELTAGNSYSGGTTVDAGLLVASEGLASLGSPQSVTATINGGGLILSNTSASSVNSLLQAGYNGGLWNGSTGINSSAATADTTFLHAVGMLQPSVATVFEGQPLGTGDVAVKYTYYGDANLDGKVDGSDYSSIDANYVLETPSNPISGWYNGDFNYDGVINGSDYTLIDNAFNTQGAVIASQVATATAEIAGSSAASAVPEPATLGLLGVGALGILARRRRRH